METIITGRAWVFGNNIDTDQIYPGRYLELVEPSEIGRHCMAGVDEGIAPAFQRGDIVVAGTNFGCGSSREHAVIALMNMGAGAVIADSFARIFYRNSLNLGLPLIVCKGIGGQVEEGERIQADIKSALIRNLDRGTELKGEVIGDYAMKLLQAGGIKPLMQSRA